MIGSDLDGGGDGGSSGAGDGVGEDEDFMYNDDEANHNLSTSAEDFIVINTNARSLCPKINSLVDCFEEVGDCSQHIMLLDKYKQTMLIRDDANNRRLEKIKKLMH